MRRATVLSTPFTLTWNGDDKHTRHYGALQVEGPPLCIAALMGHVEVVSELLAAGAKADVRWMLPVFSLTPVGHAGFVLAAQPFWGSGCPSLLGLEFKYGSVATCGSTELADGLWLTLGPS